MLSFLIILSASGIVNWPEINSGKSISLRLLKVLKVNHLKPDWLVHRNQRIIIEHTIGTISVKMEGIALSNGAKGDRVSVKNISSNKIIEGFVESAKKISVFNKI